MKQAILIMFMVIIVAVGCQKEETAVEDTSTDAQAYECLDKNNIMLAKAWSWMNQPDVHELLIEDMQYIGIGYWHMKDIETIRTGEGFCECQGTLILTTTKQEFPLRWRIEEGSMTLDGENHQVIITDWKPVGVY